MRDDIPWGKKNDIVQAYNTIECVWREMAARSCSTWITSFFVRVMEGKYIPMKVCGRGVREMATRMCVVCEIEYPMMKQMVHFVAFTHVL